MTNEKFIEDINKILINGYLPKLFQKEEKTAIIEKIQNKSQEKVRKILNNFKNLKKINFFLKLSFFLVQI